MHSYTYCEFHTKLQSTAYLEFFIPKQKSEFSIVFASNTKYESFISEV
ncbi:MAG: hypothetical protein Q8S84_00345 [bacterium]|nr:hypothetical protein [bacterium]MDP3380039.1 hypothetical protein [bacterium]